ncbi:DUF4242 domain-containing protein [Terrabacter sp. 2RAF25]|uniref:DUF4242 domain-containing protein n=1 Tax=Terrabacter sp. 2RAF25 TaxID=3232998 RepID=UPI003F949668
MAYFIIEREFAQELENTPELAARIQEINDEESVRWIYSFLSLDRLRTFCLYEAGSADAVREAARHAGIPADRIIEVGARNFPDGSTRPLVERA